MAWDDEFDYYVPESWSERQADLYDDLVNADPVIAADQELQFLYQEALFDLELSAPDRQIIIDMLEDYLMDQYGIDFDDVFDWDAYRSWYENA